MWGSLLEPSEVPICVRVPHQLACIFDFREDNLGAFYSARYEGLIEESSRSAVFTFTTRLV